MAESGTGARASPARDELAEVSSHPAPPVADAEGRDGVPTAEVQTPVAEDRGGKIPSVKGGEGLDRPESSAPTPQEPPRQPGTTIPASTGGGAKVVPPSPPVLG